MAKNRSVSFIIGANISQLEKKLTAAQKKFRNFGYKMQRTGRKLTRNLSVPIGLAGGAAIKLAADFEESMTRIQTLVGLSSEAVDGMRKSVIALSNKTGQSSKELSEALFTVTSAGLRGDKALQVLEQSAKASAVGLGETKQIAKATTAVLQAYGKENISAADAANTLFKTVRYGNLEASELAPTLGKVLGPASALGISFSELGANIATFTKLGVSSEEAVTGLRSVINSFIKPGAKAKKTLAEIGLSMEGMRKIIQEDGLAQSLTLLVDKFDGNLESLAKVIPNVRALSNVLGTAGSQGEAYVQTVEDMKNSTDTLNGAFKDIANKTSFKFAKALQNLSNSAIKLGEIMLPIANKILDKVTEWTEAFASMSKKSKKNLLILAGVLAAGGPLLIAIGSVSKGIASLIGGFKNIIKFSKYLYLTALPKVKSAIIAVNGAVNASIILALASAIAYVGTKAFFARQEMNDLQASIEGVLGASLDQLTFADINKQIDALKDNIQDIKDQAKNTPIALSDFENYDKYIRQLEELRKKRSQLFVKKATDELGGGDVRPGDGNVMVDTPKKPTPPTTAFSNPFSRSDNPIQTKGVSIIPLTDKDTERYGSNIEKMIAKTGQAKQKISEFSQNLANDVAPVIQNGLSDIGASFVEMSVKSAIAGNSFGGVMQSLLKSLADLAIRVGKIAIATGVAIEGIKKALQSLNPIAAIAAGGALIALGYGVKSALSKAATPSGGGGGGTIAPSTPSGPSLTNTDAQRVRLSNISNQSQFSIQQAFERALSKARLRATGSDLQIVLNNSGYTNR